ncbi:glycerophosphodiester phosphodiesterase [Fulvimarina endophytica]|uniref:Glycerophosphodiester phosphodiesterase n=1 Tax=Fulvimarina endophytica TaxID=2293836 RepID=A0A371WZR6_9HYPH|nr:glycerophosphodiester phosphodiesterase family protein [Fulvimarina endophytica]RFC62426.1 glycerophosphodiester phosphodiesterase [Fulvimarina endophytica]
MTTAPGWLTARPYAHRGLHDGNRTIPENSRAAARAAMRAGFGIECDLQLSADGVPLVFHDDDLARLTVMGGDVRAMESDEARRLNLCGTEETIPTFADFLSLVGGRVPLLIELKGRSAGEDAHFADTVCAALSGYDGPAALMSFAPHLVSACRKVCPDRPVGLTAEGATEAEFEAHRRVAGHGLDFVSYDHAALPNAFTQSLRAQSIPVLCWTIRSKEEAAAALSSCEQITFEGFLPDDVAAA